MSDVELTMGVGYQEKILDIIRQKLAQEYHLLEFSTNKKSNMMYAKLADDIRRDRQELAKILFDGKKPPGHIWCTVKHLLLDYENTIETISRATRKGDKPTMRLLTTQANKVAQMINLFIDQARTELERKDKDEAKEDKEKDEEAQKE